MFPITVFAHIRQLLSIWTYRATWRV